MADPFTHGYALLIGVDQNNVPDWALPDVANDIAALHQVLIHPERCAYADTHVKAITGPQATRDAILAGFDWLRQCIAQDADATAVVYYSGHGWRDTKTDPSQYYFIPYDVRRERLRSSALRAAEVAEAIDGLQPQRLFVLLDCCHAGGMQVKALDTAFAPAAAPLAIITDEGAMPVKEIGAKELTSLGEGVGRAVLTSSRGDQTSYVSRKAKMSIFTCHLIEALTGSAQPAAGANEVLVSDVLSYVYRRVPETAAQEANATQQPDGRLTGNFTVAMLLGGKGLAPGQTPPQPQEPLPAKVWQGAGGSKISIGKVEAVNVGETQVIDQRGATINVGDRNEINTGGGAYIGGGVNTGGGNFVGRDQTVQQGLGGAELAAALAPLIDAIQHAAPNPETQAAAMREMDELKQELAKGKSANDGRVAGILDDLAKLIPGAVAAVVSAFGTPLLGGIAGPVTQFVLDRLKRGG